jgi:hypothetical protein
MIAAVLVLGGASAGVAVATGGANPGGNAEPASAPKAEAEGKQGSVTFAQSALFVEINATDGDAGLQLNLDGEPWRTLELVDPKGRTIMAVENGSKLKSYGLTGLTFESAEPPFDQHPLSRFKAKFPRGVYRFRGTTADGRRIVGQDKLTHVFPVGPVVTAPKKDAVVSSSGLVVTWRPVKKPDGIKIVHYEVIVTNEDSGKVLSMVLPPRATRATIPREFLTPGTEHKVEVLAREASGNQTITEIPFKTR